MILKKNAHTPASSNEPQVNGTAEPQAQTEPAKPVIFASSAAGAVRATGHVPAADAGAPSADIVPAADGPLPIEGRLRKAPLRVPDNYADCTGFTLFGRRIKSLLYSTDVAVIRNSNADAIFAVYPFTAQPAITQALLTVAEAPLFVGVGGGTTTGRRAAELAAVSEMQGAAGVVLNSPATPEMVAQVVSTVDIPVVATITRFDEQAAEKIAAGARIINVAAGKKTAEVIAELRAAFPDLPIIATGGRNNEAAAATVSAGANALIWAPPSITELQSEMMVRYRERAAQEAADAAAAAAAAVVPDITDMPVADVPNGVVSTVPPEAVATVPAKGFVSPFAGRLPRLPFFGRRPSPEGAADTAGGAAHKPKPKPNPGR